MIRWSLIIDEWNFPISIRGSQRSLRTSLEIEKPPSLPKTTPEPDWRKPPSRPPYMPGPEDMEQLRYVYTDTEDYEAWYMANQGKPGFPDWDPPERKYETWERTRPDYYEEPREDDYYYDIGEYWFANQ